MLGEVGIARGARPETVTILSTDHVGRDRALLNVRLTLRQRREPERDAYRSVSKLPNSTNTPLSNIPKSSIKESRTS